MRGVKEKTNIIPALATPLPLQRSELSTEGRPKTIYHHLSSKSSFASSSTSQPSPLKLFATSSPLSKSEYAFIRLHSSVPSSGCALAANIAGVNVAKDDPMDEERL